MKRKIKEVEKNDRGEESFAEEHSVYILKKVKH